VDLMVTGLFSAHETITCQIGYCRWYGEANRRCWRMRVARLRGSPATSCGRFQPVDFSIITTAKRPLSGNAFGQTQSNRTVSAPSRLRY
jgi:hypothetical protein